MSISDSILQPLYSGGIVVGAIVNGIVMVPQTGGIIMTDATGALWLLTIGTDGRIGSQQVTL